MNTTRIAAIILGFSLLLGACRAAETETSPTSTPSRTPAPSATSTGTSTATLTPNATATRTPRPPTVTLEIIQPEITLSAGIQPDPHPLALSPDNIDQMTELIRIGDGDLWDAVWSPDGRYLAVSTGIGVFLYGANTYQELRLIDINDSSTMIAFNPDGEQIAVALGDQIQVWDVDTGLLVVELEGEIGGGIWALDFGGGRRVAAIGQSHDGLGDFSPQYKVWNAETGALLQTSPENLYGYSRAAELNDDGSVLVTIGIDWLDDLGLDVGLTAPGTRVFDAFFTPSGSSLFISYTFWDSYDSPAGVQRIDLQAASAELLPELVDCAALEQRGSAAICFSIQTIHLFEPETGAVLSTINLDEFILDASVHPNGNRLAVIRDGIVDILDSQSGSVLKSLEFKSYHASAAGIIRLQDKDIYAAALGSDFGEVLVIELETGQELQTLQAGELPINGMAFSPDGTTLAAIDYFGDVYAWNLNSKELNSVWSVEQFGGTGPIQFSPDGAGLLFKSRAQGTINLLSLETGEVFILFQDPFERTYDYDLLPDGTLISWFPRIGETLFVRNYTTGNTVELQQSMVSDFDLLEAIAISPDQRYLATGRADASIFLWDLDNPQVALQLMGHERVGGDGWDAGISRLDFHPFNNLLLSSGRDFTTRLWNGETGELLLTLDNCCMVFSPDGRFLVMGGGGVIRVWGIPPWP